MFNLKKTKIVCTLGPASRSEEVLEKMLLAGMNVARLNFSHGDHQQHYDAICNFRKVRDRLGLELLRQQSVRLLQVGGGAERPGHGLVARSRGGALNVHARHEDVAPVAREHVTHAHKQGDVG